MFPTTIWDVVHAAGDRDPTALDQIATEYRAPVEAFIRSRGISAEQAEDLCQDVFVRVLAGNVLAKADEAKGRFRSLLCTVTIRVIQDWNRRRRDLPSHDTDIAAPTADFDRAWVVHLTERAFRVLKQTSPRSYETLRHHLSGQKQERNKLWIARRKLISLIRREIAVTCSSTKEFEQELASLSPYFRSSKKD